MAAVQMNVRLDSGLKRAGDHGLELMGYTPTQAVRRLWELAASAEQDTTVAGELQRLLGPTEQSVAETRAREWLARDRCLRAAVNELRSASRGSYDYEALREHAALDRLEQLGYGAATGEGAQL